MSGLLNRAGFRSDRNLAKAYRPQRMVTDKKGNVSINVMDNMPLGAKGQNVNSTGCHGIVSTFGVRGKKFGPQKGKVRNFKKKKVARVVSERVMIEAGPKLVQKLLEIRAELLKIRAVDDWSGRNIMPQRYKEALAKISRFVFADMPEAQRDRVMKDDDHQEATILGRLDSQGIGAVHLRNIQKKVDFALSHMGRW